jgi:hypothetical protein
VQVRLSMWRRGGRTRHTSKSTPSPLSTQFTCLNATAAMQTHSDADVPADEAMDYASAHAVLLSEDLFCQQLWRWLDADAKAALRVVSKGMRSLVDGAVQVVASPRSGASANDLRFALLRWPAVRDLTMFNVRGAADLSPLSTASLAGLTSLTVREEVGACHARMGAWARTPCVRVC